MGQASAARAWDNGLEGPSLAERERMDPALAAQGPISRAAQLESAVQGRPCPICAGLPGAGRHLRGHRHGGGAAGGPPLPPASRRCATSRCRQLIIRSAVAFWERRTAGMPARVYFMSMSTGIHRELNYSRREALRPTPWGQTHVLLRSGVHLPAGFRRSKLLS